MLRSRSLIILPLLTALAAGALEVSVIETGELRLAVVEAVDNRRDAVAAREATTALIDAFTDAVEGREVWRGEARPLWGPTAPEPPRGWFRPFLELAAARDVSACVFLFLQPGDAWLLYLLTPDDEIILQELFEGPAATVLPLITAGAVEGYLERFPRAEAPPAPGQLHVTCNQSGYSLEIDGASSGLIPRGGMTFVLDPGRYELKLYDGSRRLVESRIVGVLSAETTKVHFHLEYQGDAGTDDTAFNLFGCLFDILLSGICGSSGGSSGGGSGVWGPGSGNDDDDKDEDDSGVSIWGPSSDRREREDDDDKDSRDSGIWGPR